MAFSSFKSPKQIKAITAGSNGRRKPEDDSGSKYTALRKRAGIGKPLPRSDEGKLVSGGGRPTGNGSVDPRTEALKRRMTSSNKQRGKIVGANKNNRDAFRDPDEEYGSY